MIPRLILCLSLLSLPALAQLLVVQYDGVTETPVGPLVNVGTAAPGDTIVARFRVRNVSTGQVVLTALSIAGAGFHLADVPSLPYAILAGSFIELSVSFSPTSTGLFPAVLRVNALNVNLQGFGVPSAVLTLAGGTTPLIAGTVIDFGSLVSGGSRLQALVLTNHGTSGITVTALSVSGAGFRGPIGPAAPIPLAPGSSVSFQVAFEPQSSQPLRGTLLVDQRSFSLSGLGLDPPLPAASIVFASPAAASAQQNSISVPLAAASPVSGTGTVTMEFHSGVPGVADDAAIRFMTGAKRSASVNISAGATMAAFGAQPSMAFQTGTTAGTIVFTLTLPNGTQTASLTIPPAAINFDTSSGVRRVNDLDVSLTGFDNTYSASQLAFTFYDKNGVTMQPGVIRVDATANFRLYFAASQVGGAFALLATFPVSGDATQVAGVDVQIVNSAGVAKTQRITF
jgi:hypothetical protein